MTDSVADYIAATEAIVRSSKKLGFTKIHYQGIDLTNARVIFDNPEALQTAGIDRPKEE